MLLLIFKVMFLSAFDMYVCLCTDNFNKEVLCCFKYVCTHLMKYNDFSLFRCLMFEMLLIMIPDQYPNY